MFIRKQAGFSLIELMIVVALIGILAMIAYPSYQGYTQKARRTDGKDALTQLAARQEQFYAKCLRYAATIAGNYGLDCSDAGVGLGKTTTSPEGHYSLSLTTNANLTEFEAKAQVIPGSPQESDVAKCKTLTINSFGQKTDPSCW